MRASVSKPPRPPSGSTRPSGVWRLRTPSTPNAGRRRMAELGLFTPANPVTHSSVLDAYGAALARDVSGTCEFLAGKTFVAGTRAELLEFHPAEYLDKFVEFGLPPELQGRGLIPAKQWATRHNNPNDQSASAFLVCNGIFWSLNPWVDEARGAAVGRLPDGSILFFQHPCL